MSLRMCSTAPFEEMSLRWQGIGNTVFDLTALDLNLRPPAPETNTLLLDQVAGMNIFYYDLFNLRFFVFLHSCSYQ